MFARFIFHWLKSKDFLWQIPRGGLEEGRARGCLTETCYNSDQRSDADCAVNSLGKHNFLVNHLLDFSFPKKGIKTEHKRENSALFIEGYISLSLRPRETAPGRTRGGKGGYPWSVARQSHVPIKPIY